jgi:hypothetical protein
MNMLQMNPPTGFQGRILTQKANKRASYDSPTLALRGSLKQCSDCNWTNLKYSSRVLVTAAHTLTGSNRCTSLIAALNRRGRYG